LDASRDVTVSVTDAASDRPQTASAQLSVRVLPCSDAGTPPPVTMESACFVKNPSLEGKPGIGVGTPESVPPQWTVCANTPDIGPSLAEIAASDGASYLALATFAGEPEVAGGTFCTPLQGGQATAFALDLTLSSTYSTSPVELQLWGGSTSCGRDELLWTSPPIVEFDAWKTYCGTLTPSKSFPFIVLVPVAINQGITAYLLVDSFKAKASCE
jgi:hypothetical protein